MKSYQITQSNCTMRYHDFPGSKATLLFIHGLGCTASLDYPGVASMKAITGFRRLLPDLLGSGYSDKPENFDYSIAGHAEYLKDFCKSLGLENIVVYGHSMGGAIAVKLASIYTEKVIGMIVSEANLDSGGGFFSRRIAEFSEAEYEKSGHMQVISENIKRGNELWGTSMKMCSALAVHREARSLVQGEMPQWRELLYQLSMPKFFIFGRNSLPDPDENELPKHGVPVCIVENAGHSMAWENPEGLADVLGKQISLML
ncbi:MAG: alpha/beta hydrolase [Ignavibacteria bacterium]|nr:alpha/beta hydrolase [Ignavibacteria bacterium]